MVGIAERWPSSIVYVVLRAARGRTDYRKPLSRTDLGEYGLRYMVTPDAQNRPAVHVWL